MKNNTCGNDFLVIQDEYNTVVGILDAKNDIEPGLINALVNRYDCKIDIIKSEEPDREGTNYFTVALTEEGDIPYNKEFSVCTAWLHK